MCEITGTYISKTVIRSKGWKQREGLPREFVGPWQQRCLHHVGTANQEPSSMNHWPSQIYIVDDDDSIRDVLRHLLQAEGLSTQAFASAHDFLNTCDPS